MKQINLLPKPRQEELQLEAVLGSLHRAIWISMLSFLAVFGVQFSIKLYLQQQESSIKKSVALVQNQVNKSENSKLKTQINGINNLIGDYKNLTANAPKWYNVVRAFSKLPPDGVEVNSLQIDFLKKKVTITGMAPTRDLVIELYNNIKNDPKEFYNVDYPLENVAKPLNTNFHFNFYIQDSVLK